MKPVQDFFADQLSDNESILMLKIQGYLQAKFSEKFSLKGNLTCFAVEDQELIESVKLGMEIVEEDEESQLMLV